MKGIVLGGGYGTRLFPLTMVTNKAVLPVYDRPMLFYPVEALVNAGVSDILIVVGGNNPGEFLPLFGDGRAFGANIQYVFQMLPVGIAQAVSLAEGFAGGDSIMVILGDNIFQDSLRKMRYGFDVEQGGVGARLLLKEVDNPKDYGCPKIGENGKIEKIVEKPKGEPDSNYAVTGAYIYDRTFFSKFEKLRPSDRGEYEITDINNLYLEAGTLHHDVTEGWWVDAANSIDRYAEAFNLVREQPRRFSIKVNFDFEGWKKANIFKERPNG